MRKAIFLLALLVMPAFAVDMTNLQVVVTNLAGKPVDNASVIIRFVKGRSAAKFGAKAGLIIFGGLTALLWIGLFCFAIAAAIRKGAPVSDELGRLAEGRALEYFGWSLLQVVILALISGMAGAVVGGLGSLFRRKPRDDKPAIDEL